MIISFRADNQTLKRLDRNALFANSIEYVEAKFSFSADWKAYIKVATFNDYRVALDSSDTCLVPWEVLTAQGKVAVSVAGTFNNVRITTNKVVVEVGASGYIEEPTEPTEHTKDIYEQMQELLQKAIEQGISVDLTPYAKSADLAAVATSGVYADLKGKPTIPAPYDDTELRNLIAAVDKEQGADGKSAYQLAVDNGFVGTVTEWLASLHGAGGERGADGEDGINGKDGVDGKDGYTPIKGVDYFDGAKGEKGEKGDTGATGAKGDAFKYSDFTPEQLAALKGDKGDAYTLTDADKQSITDAVLAALPKYDGGVS